MFFEIMNKAQPSDGIHLIILEIYFIDNHSPSNFRLKTFLSSNFHPLQTHST